MRGTLPFAKMHGLGNDFVVIDGRGTGAESGAGSGAAVTPALARLLGDRRRGVGFDQLALVGDAEGADLSLRFWNADGSESGACGNATRCVARAEMERTGKRRLVIAAGGRMLEAREEGGAVAVNMGSPRWGWRDIPLAREADTDRLPIPGEPAATSMGNPHCTFFVPDAEAADLDAMGRAHEAHPLFPERTNVQVVQALAPDRLRARVWERGVGVTPASGSSSCAVVVAAARRGLAGREATVVLDGGELRVAWRGDGVWLTGPTAHVFEGVVRLDALEVDA